MTIEPFRYDSRTQQLPDRWADSRDSMEERDRSLESWLDRLRGTSPSVGLSTNRPRRPAEGAIRLETDTKTVVAYVQGAWVEISASPAWGSDWTAYTPTCTWTVGNGSVSGVYQKIGPTRHVLINFTVGTTTTPVGPLRFGHPPGTTNVRDVWRNDGIAYDVSTAVISPLTLLVSGTTVTPYVMTAINQLNNGGITSTVPWTWAVGDQVQISATYQSST